MVCLLEGRVGLQLATQIVGQQLSLRVDNAIQFLDKLNFALLTTDGLAYGRFQTLACVCLARG